MAPKGEASGAAEKLKAQYETKLKALQAHCKHKTTHWMREAWAPAHFTGFEIEICDNCWKRVSKRTLVVESHQVTLKRTHS